MLGRSLRTALYRLTTLGGYPGLKPEFSNDLFIQNEEAQSQSNVLLIPDVHEHCLTEHCPTEHDLIEESHELQVRFQRGESSKQAESKKFWIFGNVISLTEDDIPDYNNAICKEDQSLRDNCDRESAKPKMRNLKIPEGGIERFQKPERKISGRVGGHCYNEVGEPKARVLRMKGVERQQEVKGQAAVKEEHQRCNKTSKRDERCREKYFSRG